MATPTKMKLTPKATTTIAVGHSTDSAAEVWQRISTTLFKVYTNVPAALALNIEASEDVDTEIKIRLAGYPWRVST
jgi:hypothetical protein